MNPKIELTKGGKKVDGKFKAYEGLSQDNRITNAKVRRGELPADQLEIYPQGRQQLNPTVSANDLTNPPTAPSFTAPKVGALPNTSLVKNVAGETQNIIAAKTKEADDLAKLRQENAAFMQEGSLADLFQAKKDEYGVDATFKELKDINLQLSDANTATDMQKAQIAGAKGQTLGQAQREVTQEDRESAVRNSGLAARAAVLQGNLETASALAKEAVQIAYQDRTLKQQNLLSQLNDLSGVVDKQTQQLVDQAKAEAAEELRQIERLETEISNAMVNGASQSEIAQLTSSQLDDAAKLSLAQSITARGSNQMRNLDIQAKNAQIASSNRANQPGETLVPTSVIEQNGTKLLINSQTGEVIKDFGASGASVNELQIAQDQQFINTVDSLKFDEGMGKAVGTNALARFTPFSADVTTGKVSNFIASVDQLTKSLTLDSLVNAKEQGATFGALSEGELSLLADSSTKINNWRRTDENGNTTHYDASEKEFQKELDTISNFSKLDFILKGGDPTTVGVVQQDDGTYWTANSDGSYTQIP